MPVLFPFLMIAVYVLGFVAVIVGLVVLVIAITRMSRSLERASLSLEEIARAHRRSHGDLPSTPGK